MSNENGKVFNSSPLLPDHVKHEQYYSSLDVNGMTEESDLMNDSIKEKNNKLFSVINSRHRFNSSTAKIDERTKMFSDRATERACSGGSIDPWWLLYLVYSGTVTDTNAMYALMLSYMYSSLNSPSESIVYKRSYAAVADADQLRRTFGWICFFGFLCWVALAFSSYFFFATYNTGSVGSLDGLSSLVSSYSS